MATDLPLIVFNTCKREAAHPEAQYSKLAAQLRQHAKVSTNAASVSAEAFAGAKLVVLAGPTEKFTHAEFEGLKTYVQRGGSLLCLAHDGGEEKLHTNLNYFLEEFGISVNADSVIRTVYYNKYFHPKECFISNGIINTEIADLAKGRSKKGKGQFSSNLLRDDGVDLSDDHGGLAFVYPYGASLNVQSPAVPILSSGPISYPLNRPIGALCKHKGGKVMVLGSYRLFDDAFYDKEENQKLQEILFRWLISDEVDLEAGLEEETDLQEYMPVPDVASMSEHLKSCLQTSESSQTNFRTLFHETLFKFDVDYVPEAVKLYNDLTIKHEALTLIPPQFEAPLPNLVPAVFPPNLKEMPLPALDLFDLDEEFASEKIRLAQLTNKYSDADVEYYVRECGDVLGITQNIERLNFGYGGEQDAKAILHRVLQEVVAYKKHTQ